MAGLEPAQLKLLPPQDSVSTNSTTSAVQMSRNTIFYLVNLKVLTVTILEFQSHQL